MFNQDDILSKINANYNISSEGVEPVRDMGSKAYTVFTSGKIFFAKIKIFTF